MVVGLRFGGHPRYVAFRGRGRSVDQLTTVTKALTVLQAFSYDQPVIGVSELARKLGMGKSSVHRILSTLLEAGFVQKTPDDRYRLGLKLYELGQQVVSSIELREVAHPVLERLRNDTGETVHLAVLEGTDVVYVDRFESPSTLRMFSRVGRRMPAHSTSSGKCMLAFGTPAATEAVLNGGLQRRGPRGITTKATFVDALLKIRSDGYCVSVEEGEVGVMSIGAPIFGHDGTCIAAVSAAGPVIRMKPERMSVYITQVRRCAKDISEAMGFGVRNTRRPAS